MRGVAGARRDFPAARTPSQGWVGQLERALTSGGAVAIDDWERYVHFVQRPQWDEYLQGVRDEPPDSAYFEPTFEFGAGSVEAQGPTTRSRASSAAGARHGAHPMADGDPLSMVGGVTSLPRGPTAALHSCSRAARAQAAADTQAVRNPPSSSTAANGETGGNAADTQQRQQQQSAAAAGTRTSQERVRQGQEGGARGTKRPRSEPRAAVCTRLFSRVSLFYCRMWSVLGVMRVMCNLLYNPSLCARVYQQSGSDEGGGDPLSDSESGGTLSKKSRTEASDVCGLAYFRMPACVRMLCAHFDA